MKVGGQILWNVYTYLRNVTDHLSDGKTPYERRFGQPFKGPIIPSGSLVEHHPITAKDQSRIHQFGKKVLPGLFLGHASHAGAGRSRKERSKRIKDDDTCAAWREDERVKDDLSQCGVTRDGLFDRFNLDPKIGLLPFIIILTTASLSSNTYNKASRLADWTFEGTQSMSCMEHRFYKKICFSHSQVAPFDLKYEKYFQRQKQLDP